MTNLRETNNEVRELLKTLASRLTKPEFDNASKVMWALINGATFDITETWSTSFIHECEEIYFEVHEVKDKPKQIYKTFELIKGGRDA